MEPTPEGSDHATLTVIYDGDCGICNRFAAFVDDWDREGRLELIKSQDPEVVRRFPEIPREDFVTSIQVVDRAGRRWEEAQGIAQILRVLPGGGGMALVLRAPGIRGLARQGYRWVARNRAALGSSCEVGP